MKSWGSLVYMHVYDHNRRRFEDNARPTYLVMYPDGYSSNTYTGFDPAAGRTYESLHLTWDPRPGAPTRLHLDIEGVNAIEDMQWRWHEQQEYANEEDGSDLGREQEQQHENDEDGSDSGREQHAQA